MPFTEDLSVFFNTDEFATSASFFDVQANVWARQDGGSWLRADGGYWLIGGGTGATTVNGIFNDEYVGVFAGSDIDVGSSSPAFTCETADVPGVNHGDTLTIDGTDYTVAGPPQHDGTGITTLILQET